MMNSRIRLGSWPMLDGDVESYCNISIKIEDHTVNQGCGVE